jgi:hypothetical protein
MSLPNQLKTARMSDSTQGKDIDNNVGSLEVALSDILGIPIDTNITAALFEVVAAGLRKIFLQDLAGDPTVAGQISRNGNVLKFHNGTSAKEILLDGADISKINGLTTALAQRILIDGSNNMTGDLTIYKSSPNIVFQDVGVSLYRILNEGGHILIQGWDGGAWATQYRIPGDGIPVYDYDLVTKYYVDTH